MNKANHLIENIKNLQETVWINPNLTHVTPMTQMGGYKYLNIKAAQNRLIRFMPYIESAFPETAAQHGIIESSLIHSSALCSKICPNVFIKDDAHLPIAGSVKARGGIHEVLAHAEYLLQREHLLMPGDDYSELNTDFYRNFFSNYTIQVGSTGNLGLSIGIMSAKLGFKVIVHMSNDAQEWKKNLLRSFGVTVIEYDSDYSAAVANGRKLSMEDPSSYFVDDENSEHLFFGYATAALRLKVQLFKAGILVDEHHPLFVYLPCGVGGAPGGITYGLKQIYGDFVHCFFAEPVGAPCFTLGMSSGKRSDISVSDVVSAPRTIADGLAVGRPSGLVCEAMNTLVSGSYTVEDYRLLEYMKTIYSGDNLFLEPSACAGVYGLNELQNHPSFLEYLMAHSLQNKMPQATHIVWATGGGLVPESIRDKYLSMSCL